MAPTEHQDGIQEANATVVIVSYRSPAIDLRWLPAEAPVIIVHNDDSLDPRSITHPGAIHLGERINVGFGPAVNTALAHVATSRVVLVNPDTTLSAEHWRALSSGGAHDLVVVPLVDPDGVPTSMVNRYPTPPSLLLTVLRAGRLLRRDSPVRRAVLPVLGAWGRQHNQSLTNTSSPGSWPAATHWQCGAACSYPMELVRQVDGFDPGYFLYLEDVDLVRRMAAVDPDLRIIQPLVAPGIHQVSSSSRGAEGRRLADIEQARSAQRYARSQAGAAWRLAGVAAGLVGRFRAWAVPSS